MRSVECGVRNERRVESGESRVERKEIGHSRPSALGTRHSALSTRHSAGFTLVETMVALVMLMIVIGSIYGAFRAANMSVARTEERADVYQTARVLLMQMNSELCSAYQPGGIQTSSLVGEDTEGSESAPQYDRVSFLTTARRSLSTMEPMGDLCRVTYSVETTPDGEPLGLFVQEDFRPDLELSQGEEERPPILLSDMVVGLNIEYLDGSTYEWQPDWVDRPRMPKAVRVELVLKPKSQDSKPITVASTANLAVSSGQSPDQAGVEEEVEE